MRHIKVRNSEKMNLYKKAINKCCMPNCINGFNLETHHIHPLKQGGKDEFNNYIVLCRFCHRKAKNRFHNKWLIKRTELYVYKYYNEQGILGLGVTSEEYSDEEFWKLLKNLVYDWHLEVQSIEQERQEMKINEDLDIKLENPLNFGSNEPYMSFMVIKGVKNG